MTDITASIATAIQAKTGGNVEGKIPEWWAEFIGMVLDELQCTGRLIPAGGMALTAEQVEDVKIVLGQLERGGPAFEAAHERLRALFPATEPGEEETKAEGHIEKSVRKGAIAKLLEGVLEADDDGWHLPNGWFPTELAEAIVYTPSSPVVPAPTETEVSARCRELDPYGRQCMDYAGHAHPHRLGLPTGDTHHWDTPAPTETGPWQRIEDVPANVTVLDCDGLSWSYVDSHWRCHEDVDGPYSLRLINDLAPFVAAEEG
ncbi:hypothetical protein [Rhodococcus sp. (in: high G+C Gram-positive bacteria)]|uniref:hypothetical protein n=1 Tax=Rhodococcus sp. TaxID=1831 RepID=UPI001A2F2175|nr:hypothetical protein [Rhodococcus sp. (in: high G+C Gram-positive bacteria)]MBJ7481760.1 hypothetical protein [Rhodococcus sp. (in: high G+C Gram-positive bacteria)]